MKFGDLISYSRGAYTHWAVYTGRNENGQDTSVQFTGEPGLNMAGATVVQGLLEPNGKVNNQLDWQLPPQSEAEMRNTIEMMLHGGAGQYDVLANNCEHVATMIRYGQRISLQANNAYRVQGYFGNESSGNMGASL